MKQKNLLNTFQKKIYICKISFYADKVKIEKWVLEHYGLGGNLAYF